DWQGDDGSGGRSVIASGGSVTLTVPLAAGDNTFTATATDAAGNTSPAGSLTISRDSTAPAAPVLDLVASDDTGSSSSDNLTNKASVHISVAAEDGARADLSDGHTAIARGGSATFPLPLAPARRSSDPTATDAAGNTSPAGSLTIRRDSTLPSAPVLDLVASDDTGSSSSDNLTNKASVHVSVAAEDGARVDLSDGQSAIANGGSEDRRGG